MRAALLCALLLPASLLAAGDYTFDATSAADHDIDEFATTAAHRLTGDQSHMCWTNQASTGAVEIIAGRTLGGTNQNWSMQCHVLDVYRDRGSSGGVADAAFDVFGSTVVEDGTWHHIATTLDADTRADSYVDGSPEVSDVTVAALDDPSTGITLGGRATLYSQDGLGYLDDCRVYDHLLDAGEIQTIETARGRDDIIIGLVFRATWMETAPGAGGSSTLHDISDTNIQTTRRANADTAESELMGLK